MGEGSGMLVLESLEHAEKRGATILAEVVGYGNTCDAHHMTSPHPEGLGAIKAIKLALEEAEIKPEDVAYVNAHGTSTPANEKGESGAIVSTKCIGNSIRDFLLFSLAKNDIGFNVIRQFLSSCSFWHKAMAVLAFKRWEA